MYSHPRSRLHGVGNVVYRLPGYPVYRAYHGPPGLGGFFSHFIKSVTHIITHPIQTVEKTVKGAEQLVTNPGAYIKGEIKRAGPVGLVVGATVGAPLLIGAGSAAVPGVVTTQAVKKGITSKNPLIKGLTEGALAAAAGAAGYGLLSPLVGPLVSKLVPTPAPAPSPVPLAPPPTTDTSSGAAPSQLPTAYGDTGANMDAYNALLAQNAAQAAGAAAVSGGYSGDGGGGGGGGGGGNGSSGQTDYSTPAGPPVPVQAPSMLSNPWVLAAGAAGLILIYMAYSKKIKGAYF